MEHYDVVVVGGGPAGAISAAYAARAGAKVLLLERTRRAPARCTGLVSPWTIDLLQVPQSLILRGIHGVRVHSPGGRTLELSASEAKAYVIDRTSLDELLLARAREAGAEVRRGVAATGLADTTLHTTAAPVGFSVLVGADGPISSVARWSGLPRSQELLVGLQAILRFEAEERLVQVFLGQNVAPGFFAWAVPAGEGELRVGLATDSGKEAGRLLAKLLKTRFPGAEARGQVGGLIPIGPPPRTVKGNVLLVGDAAGQVKPTSGGGLYFLALCAEIAGELAARGPEALSEYESAWRRKIGEELSFGLKARRILTRLTDQEIDRALLALSDPKVLELLAQADIDHPSRLASTVLGRPALWSRFLPVVEALGGWSRVRGLLAGLS